MKNQYMFHSGVKGMKWGVRKQQSDHKKARSEYKQRLKEASYDRSYARDAGTAAGTVVGVSLIGPAAKLITRFALKRTGNTYYSELSTAAGLGAAALTALGATGFMEIEMRRQLKQGQNPIEAMRENSRKERSSIK